jgi:hypothetical protein
MKSEERLRALAREVGLYVDENDGYICVAEKYRAGTGVEITDTLRAFYNLAFKDGVDSCEQNN